MLHRLNPVDLTQSAGNAFADPSTGSRHEGYFSGEAFHDSSGENISHTCQNNRFEHSCS